MRSLHNVTLGKSGEAAAALELRRRGYAILDCRFRTRHGEIDIVARDRAGTVVFVEVKARRSDRYGTAAEAVTPQKQRRLFRMAAEYLARRRLPAERYRFDVVTIRGGPGGRLDVEVLEDAFRGGAFSG